MNTNSLNIKLKEFLGDNVKRILMFLLFPQRNQFLLFNYTNRAKKNRVNLNYWLEAHNLGDELSPIIVNYMLSLRGICADKEVNGIKHLYAVGSVLTAGIQDCTVWGSGVLTSLKTNRLKNRKFDVRAVRGPLTRVVLMDYGQVVPEVYGDPAILLPLIYPRPKNIIKKYKHGLIMHKSQILDYPKNENILVIDIQTDNYRGFIDKLLSVEKIISSSLHGVILAESYGIPAILLKPQYDFFKYYDYYYSTNRYSFVIAETIEDAILLDPMGLPNNLEELREGLIKSFPYDLYEE